ncbi:MAG: acyl-CoA dehydrogenase family protein, partial [Myxococcota bacterium]|nr:acyl-CoA dehydrogenase family protein [Myxococcota bacterium]
MANFYEDNHDCRYYVEKWIDWEPLVRLTEYDFKAEDGFKTTEEGLAFYRDIFDLVGKFAANEIAPRVKEIDESEHTLSDGVVVAPESLTEIFEGIKELELHGMCLPRELGGMNCPLLAYYINSELIGRAETAVMAHHSFHGGIAMAMLMYSIIEKTTEYQIDPPKIVKTRFADQIDEIAKGNAWGSMDITEPNAGSDVGALRCKGEQDENGNWFVTGQKIFITSGHGKYHFVIARTEKAKGTDAFDGLKGLSLFLVPTYEGNGVGPRKWLASINSLEKKMGHHGSATVSAFFDRTPAQLVGERGEGFKLMLLLMNNARIAVGFESLGLCENALRMAKAYAAERPSMGKTIDHHEMIAEYLEEMETDIQSIRALAVYAAYHEEMFQKLRIHLYAFVPEDAKERKALERQQKMHQQKSRAVTPLLKYFASEKAVEIARRCIQIHGGVGYTREYGAEKLMRDAMVFPIYE